MIVRLSPLHISSSLHRSQSMNRDNAFTIMTSDNYAKGTKWIDARYHFVRHAVRQGIVKFKVIPSAENVADALTKPLGKELFEKMRNLKTCIFSMQIKIHGVDIWRFLRVCAWGGVLWWP
ncbi:hypothetical protein ACN38_g3806 [Penicillium nordicum]|uniref:Uncharacterized protein n=1 Tax=Penicillium nordicum TaxID=229535 RepID=A0A0M8P7Q3_9EURO|nr:hypothetical protein ACN38_g3806 [Penicillium nordicum]